jgi:acyl-CoA thioesterase
MKKFPAEELKRYFFKDRFANYVGIEITAIGDGEAAARMEIKQHHLNGVGLVHGGALFTLADIAAAVAANSRGRVAVAVNCTISFVKPVLGKVVFAEAREISISRRLATYAVSIKDEAGDVVAAFQGTAYRRNKSTDQVEKE